MAQASKIVCEAAKLEPVDVERVGDPGGDRNAELVEVERLAGDRRVAADVGSRSARRWPTRASAARTSSWAMAAFTPWLRPSVIAWSSVSGPRGHGRLLRPAAGQCREPATARGASSTTAHGSEPQLRSAGWASTPWR